MSSAYFAPLVTLPVVIAEAGDYVTRIGQRVTVEHVSTKHDFGCTGYYHDADWTREKWHKSGRIFATCVSHCDVVGRWEGK